MTLPKQTAEANSLAALQLEMSLQHYSCQVGVGWV